LRAMTKAYDSDLTVDQWEFLEPLIPSAKTGGRPRTTEMIREQQRNKVPYSKKVRVNLPR
jgi:transposase